MSKTGEPAPRTHKRCGLHEEQLLVTALQYVDPEQEEKHGVLGQDQVVYEDGDELSFRSDIEGAGSAVVGEVARGAKSQH